MKLIKECRHCGREYLSLSDPFCSSDCVKEASDK